MELGFKSAADAALFNSRQRLRGRYGDVRAAAIELRLTQLVAVDYLEDLLVLPQACLHDLHHPTKGSPEAAWAIGLTGLDHLLLDRFGDHADPTREPSAGHHFKRAYVVGISERRLEACGTAGGSR